MEAIQGKKLHSPQHIDVVANEKGAFGSLSTTVANFLLNQFGIPWYLHVFLFGIGEKWNINCHV